jgi:hypothetical protein
MRWGCPACCDAYVNPELRLLAHRFIDEHAVTTHRTEEFQPLRAERSRPFNNAGQSTKNAQNSR